MARVTIEDCGYGYDRFQLCELVSLRAWQILSGAAEIQVPIDHDKAIVVALRELASGAMTADMIHEIAKRLELNQPATTLAQQLNAVTAKPKRPYNRRKTEHQTEV